MNFYSMNIREMLYWSKVKERVISEIVTEFLCSLTPGPMACLLEYTSSLASLVGEERTYQGKRCKNRRFHPCVRKIP